MAYYAPPQYEGYAGQHDANWENDLLEEQLIILESLRSAQERFPPRPPSPPPPPPARHPIPHGPQEEARVLRNYDKFLGGRRAKTPNAAPRDPFPKQGGRSHTPGPHHGIGRNGQSSTEPATQNEEVTCTACMDIIEGDVFTTPCKHPYCFDCLQHMARSSIAGETGSFPPICCTQPLPKDLVRKVLTARDWARYEEKLRDKEDILNLFCPNPYCSTRLTEKDVKAEIGTCPKCWQKLCTICKGVEHRGICKENELAALAQKERWKGCPKCGRLIAKEPGTCNKMICVCGQYYCYRCGRGNTGRYEDAMNGGCNCPVWDKEDIGVVPEAGRHWRGNLWDFDGIPADAGPELGRFDGMNPRNPTRFPGHPDFNFPRADGFPGDHIVWGRPPPIARPPPQWGDPDFNRWHAPQPNPPPFRPFVPALRRPFSPPPGPPPGFVWRNNGWQP